jgi:hypothetical protein
LFSQNLDSRIKTDTVYNSLHKSKLAFQYESGFNFSGKSFIPVVFSLKYHFTDKSALKFSVGLNPGEWGFDMKHNFDNRHYNDTINFHNRFDDRHGNIERLNFALNYMLYPAPKKEINLFFGLGPRFGIGNQYFRYPENIERDSSKSYKSSSWSLGLNGLVGAEWFATRSISLFTEYSISAGYQKSDYWDADYNSATGTYTFTELKSSKFRVNDLSARLGLSVYFVIPF